VNRTKILLPTEPYSLNGCWHNHNPSKIISLYLFGILNHQIQVKIFGYPAYQISEFGNLLDGFIVHKDVGFVFIIIFVLTMLVAVVLL